MPTRIILTTTTCDNSYLDVMKVFLYGLRMHCHERTLVCADLINGTPEIYKRLKQIYKNLEVIHLDIPNTGDWCDRANMLKIMYPRLPRMMETLDAGYEQVMSIDSDILIRRPFDGIWDDVRPGTFKIRERKEKKSGRFTKVQAGVQIFGNSPRVREYYKAFMDELGENWAFKAGQAAIWVVWQERFPDIEHIQMPTTYNDMSFAEDSIVWHCKHGHFDDPTFQEEWQEQLHAANEVYNA